MASLRKKGKVWYYRYVDAEDVKRERRGASDRRVTEELARQAEAEAAKIKAGLIDPKDLALRRQDARPLADHLADWQAGMLARGRTEAHANLSHSRASRVGTLAKADRLSRLAPSSIQAALSALKDEGLSLQSVNHHRAALRAFCRWCKADGRMRDEPMAGVTGYNAREDVRHARRSLTEDELSRLIRTTEGAPIHHEMTGPDRAMAYQLAAGTGLRVNEIRSLTPESFRLDRPAPCVALKAADEKNRQGNEQPIPAPLVVDLRRWLAGRPVGESVLPLTPRTGDMIREDLEAAGIAYETAEGFADFHALRAFYISSLIRSGASVKTTQALARHSTPALTLARYAKVDVHDVAGAVSNLPDFSRPGRASEVTFHRATGTDGRRIDDRFSHHLPTGRGAKRGKQTDADAKTSSGHSALMRNNSLPAKESDASGGGGEGH